jgi:sulfur-oxidizing protein SoxY
MLRILLIPFLLVAALCLPILAQAESGPWERIDPAKALLGERKPEVGALVLDLPAVTQDGSSVTLKVSLDRRQRPDTIIEALYLFTTGNPAPELAEFQFSPAAGPLDLETRIRLDRSQQVFALARTTDDRWLAAVREVRVTVSGCLVEGAGSLDDDFMLARVRGPSRFRADRPSEIRAMIRHPMETGLREDPQGQTIPRRIVEKLDVSLEGEPVLQARFHPAIAAHPYLRFHVAAGLEGELELVWRESGGERAESRISIP